ncbi:right-handed parallel beta-helix repeat-containing protein (plasmid) [Halorarum halophilum]|uniref:Right-handed parallel beta-helix repeat-containing protein n=1 Tax=Halorarum halophilum TaxID=2743090 RepID=A0A7D5KNY5_9EURY|nr:right-handed parallel beta-helix repeat-containing protein [Halobaculum halophilum]QLG29735.1 right-handed parallel beta-helix repeat-containing protein [Halobaculum halophilum]
MRGLSTLGVGATLAGMAGQASATSTADRYEEYFSRFDTVVDMSEAGADTSGNECICPLLHEYADDDTLLMFPPGEYLMTTQFRHTGYYNLGIVGNDATIVPGTVEEMDGRTSVAGTFEGPTRLFRLGVSYSPGDKLLFEGFDFDFTAKYSGFRVIEAYVEKDMLVRDIDIVGQHDIGSFGPALFSVTDPDGISSIEGFRAPDGGEHSENTIGTIWKGPTGILVPQSHKGKLWFRDCELGGFPDNGLYASSLDGRVVVDGGIYKNSCASNIRLKASYSYIQNATVVVDDTSGEYNQPGVRLDCGEGLWLYNTDIVLSDPCGHAVVVQNDVDRARIQDCNITVGEGEVNCAVSVSEEAGKVEIFDSDIEFDGTGNAITIRGDNDSSDEPVKLLRTHITGSGSGRNGREAIRITRKGVDILDSTIKMDGSHYRRGIDVLGDDCNIDGGVIESTHHPIVSAADGTRIDDMTLRSYDGYTGLKLYSDYSGVSVTDSTIYNGISDKGTIDLTTSNLEIV